MAFDLRCHDLALHFLPHDVPNAVADELAQLIQDAIENHLYLACDCEPGNHTPECDIGHTVSVQVESATTDERFLRVVE